MSNRRGGQILGAGLLLGTLAFSLPYAMGLWDPSPLRVAGQPAAIDRSLPSMQAGQASAPFRVEQRGWGGELLWVLSGDRVRGEAGVFVHEIASPRLVAERDGTRLELVAERGRVHLQGGLAPGSSQPARVELSGDVRLDVKADAVAATLRTTTLSVQTDPQSRERLRLFGEEPLTLEVTGVEGAPWTLSAPEVAGTLAPLDVLVPGPVQFASGPLASDPFAGQSVQGDARGGLRITQGQAESDLGVELLDLDARARADDVASPSSLTARRLQLTFARPAAAPDAKQPASPRESAVAAASSLRSASGERVDLRARHAGRTLELSGSSLDYTADTGRLELRGAPARVADSGQGAWLSAPSLTVTRSGQGADLRSAVAAMGGVRFGLPHPRTQADLSGDARSLEAELAGEAFDLASLLRLRVEGGERPVRLTDPDGATDLRVQRLSYTARGSEGELEASGLKGQLDLEQGRKAAPWFLATRALTGRIDREALGSKTPDWRAAVLAADLRGDVEVRRLGGEPKRRRGLLGQRLIWSGGLLQLQPGADRAPVEVVLGASTVRAGKLEFRPETGRLDARGGLRFTQALAAHGDQPASTLVATAAEGWAQLSADPAVWERDRLARRTLRRDASGEERPRQPLPTALDALTLLGGSDRVRVSGPRGLRAEADRVTYNRARSEATLLAHPKAPPLRVSADQGSLACRRLSVLRFEPAGRQGPSTLWISANGEVVARGVHVGEEGSPGSQLGLDCGWLAARVRETTSSADALPLEGCFAGGEKGVKLLVVPTGQDDKAPERVALIARELRAEEQPLPGGRPGMRVVAPGAWRGELSLPSRGPARINGGRLEALVDVTALRGPRPKGQSEEALLRSVLSSLTIGEGLEVMADGLSVRAQRARLDPEQGAYVLEGDPATISREGLSQKAPVQVLRLADE